MNRNIYLMITTYFPTPEEPWRCSFAYDQVRAIQRATDKYEVIVLRADREGQYEFRGVRVIGFRSQTAGGWLCPWLMNRGNIHEMLRTLKSAGISLDEIAVAHGHLVPMATYLHALKSRNRSMKSLLQFHDPDPFGMLFGTGRLGWIKKVIYFLYHRSLVEKMDMLVSISKNVSRVVMEAPHQSVFNTYLPMRKAMRVLRWFRPARVRAPYVLHNGVDRSVFSPAKTPRANGNEFTIGCVAVFRDWKDQLGLLRAVDQLRERIPNVRVKFVGVPHSGTALADCQRLIREKNLPAEIVPSIDHHNLPDFYRSLDLFVLPSYFEGFGCVFLESHACGTPFITCEGQGMDDYIAQEDRPLWLCRQQDPADLAEKIWCFYRRRAEQRLISEADIDVMMPLFLNTVDKLSHDPINEEAAVVFDSTPHPPRFRATSP